MLMARKKAKLLEAEAILREKQAILAAAGGKFRELEEKLAEISSVVRGEVRVRKAAMLVRQSRHVGRRSV